MTWSERNLQPKFAIDVPADPSASSLTPAQAKGPEVYAQLLDAAYGTIKAVNPNKLVIGGSTSTTRDISTEQWIDYMRLCPTGFLRGWTYTDTTRSLHSSS
jgi:hypothetical protein